MSLGVGCGESARLTVTEGMGTQPVLPAPNPSLIPIVDIAPATGWSNGGAPRAADGLVVEAFARDLDHPRWLYVLPNGDVLVAETNAPERESARTGIKGAIMGLAMKRAGSATPSADRITLLRDSDGNGEPELRTTFAADLHSPFGMTLVGENFYVANTDALLRFDYRPNATSVVAPGERVAELPAGSDQLPLDEKRHRQPRWHAPLRDRGVEQQRRRDAGSMRSANARRFSRSTREPGPRPSTPPGCAIRTGSHGSRRQGRFGPSSTSATRSAAISCRTT